MIKLLGRIVYLNNPDGKRRPIYSLYRPQFVVKNKRYSGVILLINKDFLIPGQESMAQIEIPNMELHNNDFTLGQSISFMEGDRLIGEFIPHEFY